MEAFLRINFFTLLTFLYLILTWELPARAYSTQHEPVPIISKQRDDKVSSTGSQADFFYPVRGSSSSVSNEDSAGHRPHLISSPFSSSSSLREPSTLSQLSTDTLVLQNPLLQLSHSQKKRKNSRLISRNAKRNDILFILTNNNNKKNLFPQLLPPLYHLTFDNAAFSYVDKPENSNNGISASAKSGQRSVNSNAIISEDFEQIETTTMTLAAERYSSSNNNILPQANAKSTVLLALPTSPRQKRKVTETNEIYPFPVAYLMNSHYTLESPSTLIESLDDNSGNGEQSKLMTVQSRSVINIAKPNALRRNVRSGSVRGGISDIDSSDPNIQDLTLPLQADESSTSSEILPDFTTLSQMPAGVSEVTIIPTLETSQPSEDDTTGTIESTDEDKMLLNNQTAGTTPLRGKCNDTIQCFGEHVECRLNICKCQLGYLPRIDNGELCGEASAHHVEVPTTDPTMIGVVVGLALMSVTLCIVLRLFAKARFRENRTIFNTPNPRLMNVSLLKGSKTLLRGNSAGGQRSRRGSQVSMNSGQIEGQSPTNTTGDGNGITAAATAGSSHPHRVKPSRTLSTDTTNLEGTPTSSRTIASGTRSKFRQDSVASNV